VLSLNTGWVARCPVLVPDLLAYGQVRLFRRGGREIPGLFGFRAKLRLRGASAKVHVFHGQLELFTSGIAWGEDGRAAKGLWNSLLASLLALHPSEEACRVQAPPLPWMASLYSRRFEALPLADALALVVFQRWVANALLCRLAPGSRAASAFSSSVTEAAKCIRTS
jgi:hypothetical protein